MNHDADTNGRPAGRPDEPLDERALASIVRDVADDWRMPPQRLNDPTWRDRVGGRGNGRRRGPGRWLGRLAGAATLAIVATVGLSLVAVWLTLPRGQTSNAGKSPPPAAPATPRATERALPSPLPQLVVNGDLPDATSILVRVGGDFAVADLATGKLGSRITATIGNSALRRLADGSFVCICVDTEGYAAGAYTHAAVKLRTYDMAGQLTGVKTIGEYTGKPDPRGTDPTQYADHVPTVVSYSPDGRVAFVGWSARDHPVWHSGIVVVDLASGAVRQRIDLPDQSTGPDDSTVQAFAPQVVVAQSGDRVLVTRQAYSVDRLTEVYHELPDYFLASFGGGRIGRPAPYASDQTCTQGQGEAGFTAAGTAFLTCWSNAGGLVTVRRLSLDGSLLGDTVIGASGEGGTSVVTPDGSAIYFWSPALRMVTRVDLRTGKDTSGTAPAASSGSDPLAALGRWLAPAAAAKVYLDPGIVLSPDGSRLYALGIEPEPTGFASSSGVFVFDAASLASLGHWAPTADYISIAVSADGRYVYAAGAPGVDASGRQSAFAASITVYDASDGSVRLLAGQLEHDEVLFPEAIVR